MTVREKIPAPFCELSVKGQDSQNGLTLLWGDAFERGEPLFFLKEKVGEYWGQTISRDQALTLAATLQLPVDHQRHPLLISSLEWVYQLREDFSSVCDWVGVYFLRDWLYQAEGEGLVLGPFLGAATEHVHIPLGQGLCGLAITQAKTINVADVSQRPEYLACSLETASELVIPLYDPHQNLIGELDIDCHRRDAFDGDLQRALEERCRQFTHSLFS